MSVALLIAALLGATTEAAEDVSGRGIAPTSRLRARWGLSAALGLGPSHLYYTYAYEGRAWAVGEGAFFVDLDLGRFGARLSIPFKLGSDFPVAILMGGFTAELRVHFNERFEAGLGASASLGFSDPARGHSLFWAAGPMLTPVALRLGERREHELSVSASLLATGLGSSFTALFCVRYAHLF